MRSGENVTSPHAGFKRLVYDIGMHNGNDTAFYLQQGHDVVAVEADPLLAESGQQRFKREIQDGRLHILNVGIAQNEGHALFWICDGHSPWNSFDRVVASRNDMPHHSVEIRTRTFRSIVKEFGLPEYLKVDIEGCDEIVIRELRSLPAAPRYISAEVDFEAGASAGSDVLALLYAAGYRKFKLIRQTDHLPLQWPPSRMPRIVELLVGSAAVGKLSHTPFRHIFLPFSPHEVLRRKNGVYPFPPGSSGAWGEDTAGKWLNYESARKGYEWYRAEFAREHPQSHSWEFWCDWHASTDAE